MPAKNLSDQALRAIALDGAAQFLGSGNPQARHGVWAMQQENGHRPAVQLAPTIIDVLKIGTVPDVLAAPESLIRHDCWPGAYPPYARREGGIRIGGTREAPGQFDETVSRLRPLARRRFSTMRPFLLRIRTRKPWVRLRLRLFG